MKNLSKYQLLLLWKENPFFKNCYREIIGYQDLKDLIKNCRKKTLVETIILLSNEEKLSTEESEILKNIRNDYEAGNKLPGTYDFGRLRDLAYNFIED